MTRAVVPTFCIMISSEAGTFDPISADNLFVLPIYGVDTALGSEIHICIDYRCLTVKGVKKFGATTMMKKMGWWWSVEAGLQISWKAWSWPHAYGWTVRGFITLSVGYSWCIGVLSGMVYFNVGGSLYIYGGTTIGKSCGSNNGRPNDYEGWNERIGSTNQMYACGMMGFEITLSLTMGFAWRGGGGWRRRRKCTCPNPSKCSKCSGTLAVILSLTMKPLCQNKNQYMSMGLTLKLQITLFFGIRVNLPSWHWSPLFPPKLM